MIHVLFCIHNRKVLTLQCLRDLKQQSIEHTITVFDDGSTDGSSEAIRAEFPSVKIVSGDGSFFWTRSMNAGLREILAQSNEGDFVLTLNDDTRFAPDYLEQLMKVSGSHQRAIVGSLVRNGHNKNKIVDSGLRVDWKKYRLNSIPYDEAKDFVAVDTLSCRGVLVPIEVFHSIGLFSETIAPHYGADLEFFFRAKKHGFHLLLSYRAEVLDMGPESNPKSKRLSGFFGRIRQQYDICSPQRMMVHVYNIVTYCPQKSHIVPLLARFFVGRLKFLLKG